MMKTTKIEVALSLVDDFVEVRWSKGTTEALTKTTADSEESLHPPLCWGLFLCQTQSAQIVSSGNSAWDL
jgi:hypothetical protein